jgi:hypothetical protein
MNMALPPLLARTIDDLERHRSELIALVEVQPGRATGSAVDAWNIEQIVDHLLLAEGFTNDLTAAMADRAADTGAPVFPENLEQFAPLPPPTGIEAPEPIRPRRRLEGLPAELRAMSVRTRASFERMALFDPREFSIPHPLFGELDLGQWWVLQGVHYDMHLSQSRALTP